jgi:hypothetical protein
VSSRSEADGQCSTSTGSGAHVIVLPGGGYATHAAHEGEPIVGWLKGLGVDASVFRYPLMVRHPEPLHALRAEIRRVRHGGDKAALAAAVEQSSDEAVYRRFRTLTGG